MEKNLPKYSNHQKNGDRAEKILDCIMSQTCIVNKIPQEHDLGIDFSCIILKDGKPTPYNFFIQCKGTKNIDLSKFNKRKCMYPYSIKTSTINYWRQKRSPTVLFLVDINNQKLYWTFALNQIENENLDTQKTKSINIPLKNCIDSSTKHLPEEFIFEIVEYYVSFSQGIVNQLEKIENETIIDDIKNENFLKIIVDSIDKNTNNVLTAKNNFESKLYGDLKLSISESIKYFHELDQIDSVVRRYCPHGVFNSLGFGNKKTIKEYEKMYQNIISAKKISFGKLYNLSLELIHIEGNVLGFLQECCNEDLGYVPDRVKKEIKNYNKKYYQHPIPVLWF